MSLHNQSYLASSRQADLHREAVERRLVARERHIHVDPVTHHTPAAPSPVKRLVATLSAAMRPVRRFGFIPRI